MTNSNDRLNQIEELLQQSIIVSDERMTRWEHRLLEHGNAQDDEPQI